MAKRRSSFLDLIENTLKDIQTDNRDNPAEPTADPSVFDLLKKKLREVNDKVVINKPTTDNQGKKTTKTTSIFDIIRNKIDDARNENRDDPEQPTAPPSIFDILKKKVKQKEEEKRQRDVQRAEESIHDLIDEYNIDVSMISDQELRQIQERYLQDNKHLDQQYAEFLRKTNHQRRSAS